MNLPAPNMARLGDVTLQTESNPASIASTPTPTPETVNLIESLASLFREKHTALVESQAAAAKHAKDLEEIKACQVRIPELEKNIEVQQQCYRGGEEHVAKGGEIDKIRVKAKHDLALHLVTGGWGIAAAESALSLLICDYVDVHRAELLELIKRHTVDEAKRQMDDYLSAHGPAIKKFGIL